MPLPPPLHHQPASPEDELRRSRERLLLALEAGHMGTWDWDIHANRVAWSPTLERLHGIEPGTFEGTFAAFLEDMVPEDRERVMAQIDEALEGHSDYVVEYRIIRPDGAVRWLESRGRLFHDEKGEPSFMAGVCSDVTERKRGEEALRLLAEESRVLGSSLDSETTLQHVASMLVPELADWCAIDLVSADRGLKRLATRHADPEAQAWAQRYLERYPPDPAADVGPAAVLRSGEPILVEEITDQMLRDAARDPKHLDMLRELGLRSSIIVPLRARDRVLGALTLATAESRRRFDRKDLRVVSEIASRAAQAVDNARIHQDLERALAARERVLAVVSHDLREPLNSISLALSLIEESDRLGGSRVERSLASARRGLEQAERLIGDLLDVSRLDSGTLPLDRRPVDPRSLVREAAEPFTVEARQRGVDFDFKIGEKLPTLQADRHRLTQVISNLLRNAIEVTPEGGRLEVSVDSDDEERTVRFRIADSGPGIQEQDLDNLFDAFWQGDGPGKGSAGLGLAIARGLVEAHDGKIEAESEPGSGAVFTFTLPAAG